MFFALDNNGQKIAPSPGLRAVCPSCHGEVIAMTDDSDTGWWRHASGTDCDPWADAMSAWHTVWREYLASKGADLDVLITRDGETHRADAVLPDGRAVKLQQSRITADDIRQRETFFDRLLWIFDVREAYGDGRLTISLADDRDTLLWPQPDIPHESARKPVRLDLGEGMIFRLHPIGSGARGQGHLRFVLELGFNESLQS